MGRASHTRKSLEMTDYADYDDRSLASDRRSGDNPAFGMASRNSLSGRGSIDGVRRGSFGARQSFDQVTPRTPGQNWSPSGNVPPPPGTPGGVTRLHISKQTLRL